MGLSPLRRLSHAHWDRLIGSEICTADNHFVGTVNNVQHNIAEDENCLEIQPTGQIDLLRVPVSAVGIICARRVMLDVTADKLSRIRIVAWR